MPLRWERAFAVNAVIICQRFSRKHLFNNNPKVFNRKLLFVANAKHNIRPVQSFADDAELA
jgi:hypothetical protein